MEDGLQDEIIAAIGEDAYEKLAVAFAGVRLFFASGRASPTYEVLEAVIGVDATNLLQQRFSKENVEVPLSRLWLAMRWNRRGYSNAEIAFRLRMTLSGIRVMMRRSGHPAARPSQAFIQETEQIWKTRQAGKSFAEISEQFGLRPIEVLMRINGLISDKGLHTKAAWSLLKSASRMGKAYINNSGEVVVRPKSSFHRLQLRAEVDQNRSGGQIVTYTGKIGISFGMLVLWLTFCVGMLLTFFGIIIAFFAGRSSHKTAAKAFENISTNAIEAVM